MEKIKKIIPSLVGSIIYILISIIMLSGDKLLSLDIYKFMLIVLGIPMIIALIDGMIIGNRNKFFKNGLTHILFSTLLLGAIIFSIIILIQNSIGIEDIINNTKQTGNLSISVNSNINISSFLQPIMILMVVGAIGNFLGCKSSNIINKLKN